MVTKNARKHEVGFCADVSKWSDELYLYCVGVQAGDLIVKLTNEEKVSVGESRDKGDRLMQTCPSCGNALPERGFFCAACAAQARCKECGELLEPKAIACVICGTRVGQGSSSTGANASNSPALLNNTLSLKETRSSRSVDVSFTNESISNISEALGHILMDRLGSQAPTTHRAKPVSRMLPGMAQNGEQGKEDFIDAEVEHGPQLSGNAEAGPYRDRLRQVFSHDGERLVLDNLHLKATAQLDAARRLVYLFLYAHELEGRQQVPRDDINDVLKDVGLYDPNIVNWISTSSDLRESTEGEQPMFRLRGTGRDEAKKILEQVLNPEIKDEWVISDRARTRSKSSSDSGSADKSRSGARKGRRASTEPDTWTDKWTSLDLGVDGHSIVETASGLNKGIFGLWAIRKATADTVKVVSETQLVSFLHKAFVVKVSPSTLRDALVSKQAKGKVLRVKGGYEITPTGMAEAQALAGLTKGATSTSSKSSAKKKS